jgi:hypothetical protein
LPGARGNAVVRAGQIGLGDLQVEHWLAFGVVPGLDDLPGIISAGWCVCRWWCPRNRTCLPECLDGLSGNVSSWFSRNREDK